MKNQGYHASREYPWQDSGPNVPKTVPNSIYPIGRYSPMHTENYSSMIAALERDARDNPQWYRFRVACLVFLAYFYIGVVLIGGLALLAVTLYGVWWMITHSHMMLRLLRIAIPVVIGLLIFCFSVLRALWVNIDEPHGRVLSREEALPLFQEIDRLRGLLNTPKFDKVILSAEFNAGVKQVPRLGLFGWNKNILVIGVPLMLC
jgi:hypothetical protein